MRNIKGLTALVTGASSGIGREIARELAKRGCKAILLARRRERLNELAAELQREYGAETVMLVCDLSKPGEGERVFAECGRLGLAVDILVNNAGLGLQTVTEFSDPGRLESMIRVNMVALSTLCALFGAQMRERRSGYILNVASVVADFPIPYSLAYSATKTYVAEYTRTLRYELKRFGVGVTCLYPGSTATEFFEAAGVEVHGARLKMMALPADVAASGVKAMLRRRRSVTPGLTPKSGRVMGRIMPSGWLNAMLRGRPENREAHHD